MNSVPLLSPLRYDILKTYPISSGFGYRHDPITGQSSFHAGLDLPAPFGTPVYATADGIITKVAYEQFGLGLYVVVSHANGFETIYGHLSKFHFPEGYKLHRGQLLAQVGTTGKSTGNHLHYAIKKDGVLIDPLPFCYFLLYNQN